MHGYLIEFAPCRLVLNVRHGLVHVYHLLEVCYICGGQNPVLNMYEELLFGGFN